MSTPPIQPTFFSGLAWGMSEEVTMAARAPARKAPSLPL